MPLPRNPDGPHQDSPEVAALREQNRQLSAVLLDTQQQLEDLTARFVRFVRSIRGELDERGAVTRAEIKRDLELVADIG